MKVLLLTFGDGSKSWRDAAKRLKREAAASNYFDFVEVFDLERMYATFPEFKLRHRNFIEDNSRGLGYWIWKPYLISALLDDMRWDFDLLVYLDAGCSINSKTTSSQVRFREYCEIALRAGGLFFAMNDQIDRVWNKKATITALGADKAQFLDSKQVLGGISFFTRSESSITLAKDWLRFCVLENYRLVDDSPSSEPEDEVFRSHRHDQAILSLLVKKLDLTAIPDETYFPNSWNSTGLNFPIWATRNSSAIPYFSDTLIWRLARRIYRILRSTD